MKDEKHVDEVGVVEWSADDMEPELLECGHAADNWRHGGCEACMAEEGHICWSLCGCKDW